MVGWRVRLILAGVAAVGMGVNTGAQQAPSVAAPLAACGPADTQFKITRGAVGDTAAAESAKKATVYVIETYDERGGGESGQRQVLSRPQTRVGMDGAWMGAMNDYSYVRFSAEPGTRHVCTQWKGDGRITMTTSLYNFDTEAGKTYYLRVQIMGMPNSRYFTLDLQPVSTDEGRFLVSETARSISQAK